MTRKTFNILSAVLEHLQYDEFGIVYNVRLRDLHPLIESDEIIPGMWLWYYSGINEVFYYTGYYCDKVYNFKELPDKFIYLYKLE